MLRFVTSLAFAATVAMAGPGHDHGEDGHSHDEEPPTPIEYEVTAKRVPYSEVKAMAAYDKENRVISTSGKSVKYQLVSQALIDAGKVDTFPDVGTMDPCDLTVEFSFTDTTMSAVLELTTPGSYNDKFADLVGEDKQLYFAFLYSIWRDGNPADGLKITVPIEAPTNGAFFPNFAAKVEGNDAHVDNGMNSSHNDEVQNITLSNQSAACEEQTKACKFSVTMTRNLETGNFDDIHFLNGDLYGITLWGEYIIDGAAAASSDTFLAILNGEYPTSDATEVLMFEGDYPEEDNAIMTTLSAGFLAAATLLYLN